MEREGTLQWYDRQIDILKAENWQHQKENKRYMEALGKTIRQRRRMMEQGKREMTLSEDLKFWRAERPDEWTRDRLIRKAKQHQKENEKQMFIINSFLDLQETNYGCATDTHLKLDDLAQTVRNILKGGNDGNNESNKSIMPGDFNSK